MKSGDGGPTPQRSHKAQRRVGAGLSLDKFAAAGVSKYDKRQVIERQRKEKIIKHSKYSKLKHKLEAQGVLKPLDVKDRIAELEELDHQGPAGTPRAAEVVDSVERHDAGPAGPSSASDATVPASKAVPAAAGPKHGRQGQLPEKNGSSSRSAGAVPGTSGYARAPGGSSTAHGRDAGAGAGASRGGADAGSGGARPSGVPPAGKRQRPREDEQHGQGEEGGHDGRRRPGAHHKPMPSLQRLAQKVSREREEQQRARDEAHKAREARQQHIAVVQKARKDERHNFFKCNAKGQPLMRYRMEKLLAKIQQDQ